MTVKEFEPWVRVNWTVAMTLTGRSRGISMARRLTDLKRYLRGWIGYWKQWRYPRTKIRMLIKLGVTRKMAIKHGISRKKYWRMSRTPAMRYAMPNKWLEEQGLFSLNGRWSELAPLRGIAQCWSGKWADPHAR